MSAQDIPVVQGLVLFGATVFVVVNLVVDLIYPLLDPRIVRPGRAGPAPPAHRRWRRAMSDVDLALVDDPTATVERDLDGTLLEAPAPTVTPDVVRGGRRFTAAAVARRPGPRAVGDLARPRDDRRAASRRC